LRSLQVLDSPHNQDGARQQFELQNKRSLPKFEQLSWGLRLTRNAIAVEVLSPSPVLSKVDPVMRPYLPKFSDVLLQNQRLAMAQAAARRVLPPPRTAAVMKQQVPRRVANLCHVVSSTRPRACLLHLGGGACII
jgi:hypothetical protein